jgi:DNA-binding CsgD family transcriptional regulator
MVRNRRERRGRPVRGSLGLLEREHPLGTIAETLDAAHLGSGRGLMFEGHAGLGKTRLHEATLDRARSLDFRVLRAAGSELEHNVSFGVAAQLLGSLLHGLPEIRRRAALESAPERIRRLAGFGVDTGVDTGADAPLDDHPLSHALFSMIGAAAETQPVLIAVDDLHWADPASLEFIVYALQRIAELRVAIVMASRPGAGQEAVAALDRIAAHPRIMIEPLEPLGEDAVLTLARRRLGLRANDALVQACLQATTGNPFYINELLVALETLPGLTGDQLARRAVALAPDAVTRTVRVRVGRLGADAAALARALAVLGDDAPLRHAAALADLGTADAVAAADRLAAAEVLLAREPLRFVHPLVRHAIERDIPASERASQHLAAARLAYADGQEPEHVAAHLLLGRSEGNEWVVNQLCAAATEARERGFAAAAARYLDRALDEPPRRSRRSEILAALGRAQATIGDPAAPESLAAAARQAADPLRRAELTAACGNALYAQGRHAGAAEVYAKGLDEVARHGSDPALTEVEHALQTGFVATAAIVPGLRVDAIRRSAELRERIGAAPSTQGQRLLFAQAAIHGAWAGSPADEVTELAERSWDDGRLLESETADGIAWSLLVATHRLAGRFERALELIAAVDRDAQRRCSPLALATTSYLRGAPLLGQGNVSAAIVALELAMDARSEGWRHFTRSAVAFYCLALIETGELEQAEDALLSGHALEQAEAALLSGRTLAQARDALSSAPALEATRNQPCAPPGQAEDLEDVLCLYSRAELSLAQGRPQEALDDALAARDAIGPWLVDDRPWRTVAAQAALALGDRDQALQFARADLEHADRTQVLHARIRARRVLGVAQGGETGLESLRAAVELGQRGPGRLETIRALIEFGAALRRANRRTQAREPLQSAADLAQRGGARALYERARTELAASGARPRRELLLSGPESLTPSERRVAELAAAGRTNREISQTLFVTPKTVEFHLRNVYRKLEIDTRRELARALAA